jgi:hypothetical protein
MKKQPFKIKLVLNSQTIRRLHSSGLKEVQAGRQAFTDLCVSDECTANCRACG